MELSLLVMLWANPAQLDIIQACSQEDTRSFKSVREYDVNTAKTFWFGEFGLPSRRDLPIGFQCASCRLCEFCKLFYSLLTIVLSATLSAPSEDTPSSYEIGRISAEVFSDDDEFSLRGSYDVTMSSCLFALVCLFFFCGAWLRCWWMLDKKWILRETVSTNLVLIW